MSFQFSKCELLYQRQQFYENIRNNGVPCKIYSIEDIHEKAYDFYNDIRDVQTYTMPIPVANKLYESISVEVDTEKGSSCDPIDLTEIISDVFPMEDIVSLEIKITTNSYRPWTHLTQGIEYTPSFEIHIDDTLYDTHTEVHNFDRSGSISYSVDMPENASKVVLTPVAFRPGAINFRISIKILDNKSSFDDYIDTYMTFEELPTIKTLKSLGWYIDSESMPAIGHIPVLYQDKKCRKANFKPNVDDKIVFKSNPYDDNSSERAFLLKDFKGNGFPSVIYYTVKLVPCYNDKEDKR